MRAPCLRIYLSAHAILYLKQTLLRLPKAIYSKVTTEIQYKRHRLTQLYRVLLWVNGDRRKNIEKCNKSSLFLVLGDLGLNFVGLKRSRFLKRSIKSIFQETRLVVSIMIFF